MDHRVDQMWIKVDHRDRSLDTGIKGPVPVIHLNKWSIKTPFS